MNDIEHFANKIMREACAVQASDLHIVPNQENVMIQLRIGQDLMTKHYIEKQFGERLISHFKFLASMDIGERRKPQNGSLYLQIDGQEVHLRLSTLPTVYLESLVIRLHLQASIQPLSHLSLFPSSAKKLLSFLHHSHGLLVFTGPTGQVLQIQPLLIELDLSNNHFLLPFSSLAFVWSDRLLFFDSVANSSYELRYEFFLFF